MTIVSAPMSARRETVQVTDGRGADVVRRPRESAAIFVVAAAAYVAMGEWLVRSVHVVGFDALDRLSRALMVWHNNPGKLSALGFDIPPLDTLAMLPFTFVSSWTASLTVLPLASALAAAWLMVILNTVMRRCALRIEVRYPALLALGANPLLVLYAADGYRDLIGLTLVVTGLAVVLAWYITADVRFVMIAGLVFGCAALAAYDSMLFCLGSMALIGAVLARHHADGDEVEGTTIGLAVPIVYAVCLWVVFNLVLTHHAFGWLPVQHGAAHVPLSRLVTGTGQMLLYGAPIVFVVLPALIVRGFARDDVFGRWLAVLLAIACVEPALATALRLTSSPLALRGALPVLVISVMGAAWVARSSGRLVGWLLVIGLLASIPWTFVAMERVPRQNLEAAFTTAIRTGADQDGTRTPNGSIVGIERERDMADWITQHVHGQGQVLTDNAQTYAVILLTGRPQLFFDRVDRSDGPWKETAAHPEGHVSYLLFSRNTAHDLLAQAQPMAAAGRDSALPIVHANERYVLVRVADTPAPATGGTR